MRIELFGVARSRAGREVVEIEAATLGEALRALLEAVPDLAPHVDHLRFNLNGERFVSDPALALGPRDTLVVMGAQAGG